MILYFPPPATTWLLKRMLLAGLTCLLGMLPLGIPSAAADNISLIFGDYSLEVPAQGITRQTLLDQSLATHYSDQSSVTVSIVQQADFEERAAIPAAEYLKNLFGDGEPTNSILQVLRDRATRDLQNKHIENKGRLTYYVLTFPDHSVAHIADDYQPEYYVSIETRKRPLRPLLDSLSGGKVSQGTTDGRESRQE